MKISIITVVFNNEKTIQEAMESVFSQSYKNVEYIIIDGKSSDSTAMIIKRSEEKLGHFISEKDNGIYHAMNKGIALATGDVIGILNSDDLYPDNQVIKDVMDQFNADPDLDLLYGDLVYVKSEDTKKIVRKWKSKKYYESFFENGNVPPHPTLFLRKRVYLEAGFFDLKYKLAADYDFMLRIFKKHHYKSQYLNRLMVKMRLGGATNKNFNNILNGNREILDAWENNSLKAPIKLMPLRIIHRLIQFL